jgi:nucleotide-binding universal stress UspA family protein
MPSHRPPRLVVGFDGSPEARRAVAVAARRAGRRGRVWVVHAYQSPPQLYDTVDRNRWRAEHCERAQALLDTLLLTGDAELLETNYETELAEGPAPTRLVAAAQAHDADEIVVGSRGLGGVHALLGSVSHELIAVADRPVLVIPAGALSSSDQSGSAPDAGRTTGTRR